MKILILAHPYLNLHVPIIEELKKQGHNVVYIEDKKLKFDYHYKYLNKIKKFLYLCLQKTLKTGTSYWRNKFNELDELNTYYDVFFCIQGLSFSKILINHLRTYNPNIKTSLYIWDSNKYYNFFRNISYFDNVYTFDLEDSKISHKVNFLPFYWIPSLNEYKIKYDLSFIGTDHDNRLSLIEKMKQQIIDNKLSYYIKVVKSQKHDNSELNQIKSEFIINRPIDLNDSNKIMQESNCILDIDRPIQSGTTPRFIWAMALGKKIITTNEFIKNMPFYDKNQILIINRDNPVLDIEFIKDRKNKYIINDYVNSLRIDKWISNFI